MSQVDERGPAELEKVMDEVHSRLANHYGRSKADIAKLAVKRYGGNDMNERTEEVLANARSMLTGGREDAMDKMIKWEMIRDMRSQRNNPQQPQYPQEQPMQQPQSQPMGMPSMQEMFMMMMMPQMMKAMSGGEDDMMKMYKMYQMRQLMGDSDGKGADMEKLVQLIREEQAESEKRSQQLMDQMFGRQEAEKLQAKEVAYRREMEQRVANAEYLARHPSTPLEPLQSAKQKLDESLDMMVDMKSKMEGAGMVHTPPSPEDKKFELDKMNIGHSQGIESKAVESLAKSADKLSDTVNLTTNKVIDLVAKEQDVKATHLRMQTPEGQAEMQQQYENLADQVIQEPMVGPAETRSDLEFSEEDDLDATE